MKILSLGLDDSILNKTSALNRRAIEYGELVENYTVIVPSTKNEKIELSGKARVYSSGGSNKLCQFIKIYYLAKKLLWEEKYDVITVQDQYYLALIGFYLSKKLKIGLEVQVHGFEKYYGIRKLISKYVLPRASAVRSVSRRLKKQLIDKFGVKEDKITIVPIYSELKVINYKTEKKHLNKFIFLTAGRLVPVKNIRLQIEAMREVVKKYPTTELWVIGDGPEKEKLKLETGNWKLETNIKLIGRKNSLNEYYNMADAFVLSSNSEGWGLAVIEAASFGLPIIMTDVGCAGEVIRDQESGLVIPVGDKPKLIEAMLKIIKDENLKKKLGANAKSAVCRLPSKEQTLELYKKSWEIASINKL